MPGSSESTDRSLQFAELAPLMRLADLMTPLAVRVAATLRLADHIARGTTRLPDLAAAVGADEEALRRLMRFLAARGIFTEPEKGTYELTKLSRLLLDDHPGRLRARFDLNGPVGRGDLAFIHLLDTVRTGRPSFAKMYGRSFWEDLNADAERAAEFARMQAANAARFGIEKEYDWHDVKHVVDVGGGNGTLLSRILEAHPHLQGTLVEMSATAEQGRKLLAARGLADRCTVVEGSFFDPLPKGGDVYILSKVLHDWGDEEAEAILRRCAEAAGREGRVLILEMVPTGKENAQQFTYLDLHMLVYFGGKERTVKEYRKLASAVGMDIRRVNQGTTGEVSILECVVRR